MKILYLCPDLGIPVLGRKGAAVHVRELVAALRGQGHQVLVAAQMLNKSPWETPAEIAAPVLQVRPAPGASAAVQALKEFNELLETENSLPGELRRLLYNKELETELKRRFENDRPDFIYERASLYATAGVMLARAFQVPLLLELNAPLAQEQSAYRATGFGDLAARAEQWTLSHADAVLVVSSVLRDHVISTGGDPNRVHVLPNGVDPEVFHPGPRDATVGTRLNLNGGPVLGFVGGLRPWHGVEVLPELLGRLSGRHPGLRLVIVGDGPLRKPLEQELQARGLESRVLITGLVPHQEVAPIIRYFDVALAPYPASTHSFYFSPLKIFEYLGCGVPVVAPELGQIPELLANGQNGLLYPAGDMEALAARCDELISNAGLRERLGASGARLIHQQYTWAQNARRVTSLARTLRAEIRSQARP